MSNLHALPESVLPFIYLKHFLINHFFMKKKLLLLLGSVCVFSFMSQVQAQKTGHYTVYGGVLGGGNFSHYYFCNKPDAFDNAGRFGWNAGLYFGVPVTKT